MGPLGFKTLTASQLEAWASSPAASFAGAASDDRLKTNRTTISNALQKVLSLSGFTFNWNEKAISLGFVGGISQVGVSAQQVQEVLPEAVKKEKLNDEEILIVKYEKIVPLLIEAIKELKKEIEELKSPSPKKVINTKISKKIDQGSLVQQTSKLDDF